MKKLILLSMLIAALLCAADALAVPTDVLLPDSTYRQGRSYFAVSSTNGILQGRVDFAVYDTHGANGNEYGLNPGSGRYIYAYQIFNNSGSADPLEYFAITGINDYPISGIESIDAHDDGNGGIAPHPQPTYNAYMTRGIWEFDNGLLIADAHSWFLVLSSNGAPTAGRFTVIKTSDSDDTWIPEETFTPEPASLALIGIGSLLMSMKKRKSRRS